MRKKQILLGLSCLFMLGCNTADPSGSRPNIILILADDLGYMDTGVYAEHALGVPKNVMFYETPNIDRLAGEGVAFEQAYANQLCSPTRASVLTGKYAARLGFTTATPLRETYYNTGREVPEGSYAHDVLDHHDPIRIEMALLNGSSNTALPSGAGPDHGWDETTLPEALSDHYSAFIGKWHIGGHGARGYTPADQGFDETLAWLDAGASAYFNWRESWNSTEKHFPDSPQQRNYSGNAGDSTGRDYLTDDLSEQAVQFIRRRSGISDQPFFLYFCHFAVHAPNQAKREDVDYFENKATRGWNGHRNAEYAGMIRALDNSVGRILETLEETGLDENTLVVFMSDNGGIDREITPNAEVTSNYPLKGGKACLTEGGVRVPLIFRWKGKLDRGKWCSVPVDCNDIFPSLLEAASYDPDCYYDSRDPIDGRSLFGLLDDVGNAKESYTRDTYYWHYPFNVIYNNPFDGLNLTPHSAIRVGDHKLLFDWHGRLRLFNIRDDISEERDLAKQLPEVTNDLFEKLMLWLKANVKPTYWPQVNPEYNAGRDPHDLAFLDLVEFYESGGNVAAAANGPSHARDTARMRLAVMADMGNEPDEIQQMMHLLMYNNTIDLVGLFAVTGKWLRPDFENEPYRQRLHPELFDSLINAYAEVYDNLKLHAGGWNSPEYLKSIVRTGQTGYGIDATGPGKASPGSRYLTELIERDDPRPLYIVANAGANTLAQALRDYREAHDQEELERFVDKIIVFDNGAQDDAGAWIVSEFPEIHWIRSSSQKNAFGGNPRGEKGSPGSLGPWSWKPYPYSTRGQHLWAKEHIQTGHGALGALYPDRVMQDRYWFLEGGGTVPWLGLTRPGLYDPLHPHWGGFSGRYTRVKKTGEWSIYPEISRREKDEFDPFGMFVDTSDRWRDPADGRWYENNDTPVHRWRQIMFDDLKCRMDWCVAAPEKANHNPVIVLKGSREQGIVRIRAGAGESLDLDASASYDPDKDQELSFYWWIYPEAGTYKGPVRLEPGKAGNMQLTVPRDAGGRQIHLILDVSDNSNIAPMHDIRRIVIDVVRDTNQAMYDNRKRIK